jgi:hypothetical protein
MSSIVRRTLDLVIGLQEKYAIDCCTCDYVTVFRGTVNTENTELLRINKHKQNPWIEFASELYPPSDRRLLAKLVPTFSGERVSRGHGNGSPRPLNSVF